jgi:hypothetical protein
MFPASHTADGQKPPGKLHVLCRCAVVAHSHAKRPTATTAPACMPQQLHQMPVGSIPFEVLAAWGVRLVQQRAMVGALGLPGWLPVFAWGAVVARSAWAATSSIAVGHTSRARGHGSTLQRRCRGAAQVVAISGIELQPPEQHPCGATEACQVSDVSVLPSHV